MIARADFLKRRKTGIGGSDVAAIAGLSPFRSPLDVFYDKLNTEFGDGGRNEAFPRGETAALYWGAVHESNIGKAYTVVTGRRIMRYNRLLQHPEFPYFIGDVDFLGYCDDGRTPFLPKTGEIRTDKGIECKTGRWANPDDWGEHGSDTVPIMYVCQVQWYMGLVPALRSFDLPVLFAGSDFRIYTVVRCEEIIAKLQEIANDFWCNNVMRQIPPAPRSLEEVKRLYPQSNARAMVARQETENAVRELAAVSEQRSRMEARENELKNLIAAEMGANELLTLPDGTPLLTFRTDRSGKRSMLLKRKNLK